MKIPKNLFMILSKKTTMQKKNKQKEFTTYKKEKHNKRDHQQNERYRENGLYCPV